MKIFESLNCCLCKSPFVPIANQPKSPRQLDCGKAACHKCFESEKGLKREERKHQCNKKDCFYNPYFAYYLIDILSEVTLVHSPIGVGYMLSKPLATPECPICHEEFLTKGNSVPDLLYCLHCICWGCREKGRKPNDGREKDTYPYRMTCSLCNKPTISDENSPVRNHFWEFLEELPEMNRQFEEMKTVPFRFCDDCKCLDHIERSFYCTGCKTKICGCCAFQKHHDCKNKVSQLLDKEALDLSTTMSQTSSNQVTAYEDIFPELHLKLVDHIKNFKEKLTSKSGMLKNQRTFETLQKSYNKCKQLNSDFETLSEEYVPVLRKYNTGLEGLIQELEKEPD